MPQPSCPRRLLPLGLLLALACAAPDGKTVPDAPAAVPPPSSPTQAEVPLPSSKGWRASLVLDTLPTGIWTVAVKQVFPQYACPEVIGLDDLGRCHVLVSYSGKWTPVTTIADGEWLGGLAQGDVDPRVPGPEVYTGGKRGNLYQVVPYREGMVDHRRIACLPGREIHTLIAADLDPARAGDELIAFTNPGELYLLTPRSDGRDGFDAELVEQIPGRVRDALALPSRDGAAEIATVSRAGRLELLRWTAEGPRWTTIHERPMGMGRVALRPGTDGPPVLYSVCDDGCVYRHERTGAEAWQSELIYTGPQGMRGVAAGRFDADPTVETIALFGYSKQIEILARGAEGWRVETAFEDRDKGHWIAAGELDGRNGTDELVASGYGGRIVLLARPPGFGLAKVLSAER
jgi:hypothetical protein